MNINKYLLAIVVIWAGTVVAMSYIVKQDVKRCESGYYGFEYEDGRIESRPVRICEVD